MERLAKKERFKVIPSVYLLLEKEGKILLSRRYNTGFEDGNYGLIAGHLDGDESVKTAMVREALEEADLTVNLEDLRVVHVLHRRTGRIENERIDIFLTTEKWSGEPEVMEPDRCDDLNWFPINQLPENTIDYIRQAIESYQKGVIYSEFGWE